MVLCSDFHPSQLAAACSLVSKAGGPSAPKLHVFALVVRVLVPAEGRSIEALSPPPPAGQEAALILALCQAALECIQQAGRTSETPTELFDRLVAALKLATKRAKAAGGGRSAWQGGSLLALATAGHNACVQALAADAYEPCVTLATSACVLLDLHAKCGAAAVQQQDSGSGSSGAPSQAALMLMAVQALLQLHDADDPRASG